MKNQPDSEHPELLVAEIMLRFPRRKAMTLDAIARRFHERYGKRCSREMVRRGMGTGNTRGGHRASYRLI